MKNKIDFINLILNCERLIQRHIPSNPDQLKRYQLMLDELEGLRTTIELNQLNDKLYYLSITQMLEKDDPEEVLKAILQLNTFYCTYYQNV
ncbi:TPA: hypothetical protein ACIQN7_002801 [Bacillus cereus]